MDWDLDLLNKKKLADRTIIKIVKANGHYTTSFLDGAFLNRMSIQDFEQAAPYHLLLGSNQMLTFKLVRKKPENTIKFKLSLEPSGYKLTWDNSLLLTARRNTWEPRTPLNLHLSDIGKSIDVFLDDLVCPKVRKLS